MAAQTIRKTTLLLLCGPPASGKTSLASNLKSHYSNNEESELVVVIFDDFYPQDDRKSVSDSLRATTVDFSSKNERSLINECLKHFLRLNSLNSREVDVDDVKQAPSKENWLKFCRCLDASVVASEDGRVPPGDSALVVALEDNMTLTSTRRDYYKLARDYGLALCTVYLSSRLDVALQRNESRGLPVPQSTIERMHVGAEPPSVSSAPQPHCVVLDSTGCRDTGEFWQQNRATILSAIAKAVVPSLPLEENVVEKEACRETTLKSFTHQADLILRRCISSEMMSLVCGKEIKTAHFQLLTSVKRQVLDGLKSASLTKFDSPFCKEFQDYVKQCFAIAKCPKDKS